MDETKLKARENTLDEKRAMRRGRNKRKKMQRRQKREDVKKKRGKEMENAKAATLEARRYKAVARKYINLWKKTAKEKKNTCEFQCTRTAPNDVASKTFNRDDLTNIKDHKMLAKGVFGKCTLKMYQGHLVVAKEFKSKVSKEEVMQEGRILSGLSHTGIPYVLGIDLSRMPYIMATLFYGIDMKNTTLYELLNSDKFDTEFKFDQIQATSIIVKLTETLAYIHNKGILHNDIKSDNIVFYAENTELNPVLIDFGKACPMKEGEFRKLSKDMRRKYRQNHSHIAPEIVDGSAPQSASSDIFSLGLVVKSIGEHVGCKELVKLGDICAEPDVRKRCTLNFLMDECKLLSKN